MLNFKWKKIQIKLTKYGSIFYSATLNFLCFNKIRECKVIEFFFYTFIYETFCVLETSVVYY